MANGTNSDDFKVIPLYWANREEEINLKNKNGFSSSLQIYQLLRNPLHLTPPLLQKGWTQMTSPLLFHHSMKKTPSRIMALEIKTYCHYVIQNHRCQPKERRNLKSRVVDGNRRNRESAWVEGNTTQSQWPPCTNSILMLVQRRSTLQNNKCHCWFKSCKQLWISKWQMNVSTCKLSS